MIREHLTDNNGSSDAFFQTKGTGLADGALGQKKLKYLNISLVLGQSLCGFELRTEPKGS